VARADADIARQGYERFASRDVEGFLELVHPDIDWGTSGLFPGMRARYVGHEGVVEFFHTFMDTWESLDIEVLEMRDVPDGVLAHLRFFARGRGGVKVDRRFAQHMTIEDGRLRRIRTWAEWPEALRALGLD
jgi:ketosteroid isomerase-like protein